jgi:hypothetical protein
MPDDSEISTACGGVDLLMPHQSRYAGLAIDATSRRSITINLNESEHGSIGADESHFDVNYFYHDGQFWRAIIPLNGVDEVFGQAFNFSKPKTRQGKHGREILFDKNGLPLRSIRVLNHVQCRFHLKRNQPVELYPLGCQEFTAPVHRIHDIIYSFEAVGPKGVLFNIRDGLAGNLISAHRFLSIQEMVFERIVVENQYVTESPPLPLNEVEKRELLLRSLRRSDRAGMNERYYLYRVCGTNNCTSSPFHIVDKVVPYRLPQRIGSALYRLPLNPRFYLWVRGLDSDPSHRKLVRSEFEEYIGDAGTQQRKRDHVRHQISIRRAARDQTERRASTTEDEGLG